MRDPAAFRSQARFWTQAYATPTGGGTEEKAKVEEEAVPQTGEALAKAARIAWCDARKFIEMGFEEKTVIEVLARLDYRGSQTDRISDDEVSSFTSHIPDLSRLT